MAGEFLWIMGCAVLDALLGFVGVFSLWISKKRLDSILYALVAFAAGSLLGGAFFHLLPESLETLEVEPVLLLSLSGFTLFLLLEAYLHWHSCKDCKIHPFSYMMMIGDGIHNFLGGIVLAASFLMSIPLGIATIIAIIAHEFPQQLGIFGVLVKGGFERKKAILYSFLAQSTIIGGALAGYLVSNAYSWVTAILVPFAAGNFIYIAAADLIPEMHRTEGMEKIRMIVFFMLGLGFMWWVKAALGV